MKGWKVEVAKEGIRAPECQKIKNGGLDQYGAGPFDQQQFGTAGVEGVKPKNFLADLWETV